MKLFTYGTLMDVAILARVAGCAYCSQAATLQGYARKTVIGGCYPAIFPQPGASVAGRVYGDVSSFAIGRLDQFEGALYRRERVQVLDRKGHCIEAWAYVIAAGEKGRISDQDWSYEVFQLEHKQGFEKGYHGYEPVEQTILSE